MPQTCTDRFPTTRTNFNFNDKVIVTLTKAGEPIWKAHYAPYAKFGVEVPAWKVGEPREMQLWEVASIFGQHFFLGCDAPLETQAVLIQDKD